ncbi:hypothetical protein [Pelagibacterium halotolerans]|nr:hypothetical protein [Pelagibacterium halotolerans]
MHADPPAIRPGRFADRDGECAMKVMVGDIELARYGANILDRTIIYAGLYRPDGLFDQKLSFDSLKHPARMLNLEGAVCSQLI